MCVVNCSNSTGNNFFGDSGVCVSLCQSSNTYADIYSNRTCVATCSRNLFVQYADIRAS